MKQYITVETDMFVSDPPRVIALAERLFGENAGRRNAFIGIVAQLRPGDNVICLDDNCPLFRLLRHMRQKSQKSDGARNVIIAHNPSSNKIKTLLKKLQESSRIVAIIDQDHWPRIDLLTVSRASLIIHDQGTNSNICTYEANPSPGEPIELELDGLDNSRLMLHAIAAHK